MAPRATLTLDYETKDWKDAKVALTRDLRQIMVALNSLLGAAFDDDNVLLPEAFDSESSVSIELIGDVTGSGASPVDTTLADDSVTSTKILNSAVSTNKIATDAVTYARMQNVSAASRLLGRGSAAGSGDPEEISLGASLSMSGTTLSAVSGGSGINQLTGDVTAGPGTGSQAATIPADTVTFAKQQDIATQRLIGRDTAGTGDPEEVTISQALAWISAAVSTFLNTPSSANLRSLISDETGTGAAVFADTPTLVTPILGTPTSGTLTNCTGLPVGSGISGFGTGVATALAANTGASGGFAVDGVAGVAAGYRLARGVTALDGSNPTTVASGLTTVVSVSLVLERSTALSSGTALVTYSNISGGSFDVYGWDIAGAASTGTENVAWIAVGT